MSRNDSLVECVEAFNKEADYNKSLYLLGKADHFFAKVLEGWIHSLRGDFIKAKLSYDLAIKLADEQLFAGDGSLEIMDLPRYVFLHAHIFDSMLMEKHTANAASWVEIKFNDDSPRFWKKFGEKEAESFGHTLANAVSTYLEACFLLHLGHASSSLEKYNAVLRQLSVAPIRHPPLLGKIYLGKALALYNMGDKVTQFEKSLEDAALAVHTTQGLSKQLSMAARFIGVFSFLGRKTEVAEWREFIISRPCPTDTKEIYLKLARRILDRCNRLDRAVFL